MLEQITLGITSLKPFCFQRKHSIVIVELEILKVHLCGEVCFLPFMNNEEGASHTVLVNTIYTSVPHLS